MSTNILTVEEAEITEEHIKEGLSVAAVRALAHASGLNLKEYNYDYGLDGSFSGIKRRGNRLVSNGVSLDFQLKASINVEIEDKFVKYNLEAKTYNDLVDTEIGTPRILILYKLPKDRNEWLKIDTEQILLKGCVWWCSFFGETPTENNQRKTIRIPKNQILTIESLKDLMKKVTRGESLKCI